MPASYPASLPVKDPAGANLSTNPHSTLHDGMYDEIVAIATELSTNPKGTYASVKARLDAMPRGKVAYAQVTDSQLIIDGTPTDLTGLSVTWTAETGRRYKATFRARLSTTTGTDRLQLRLLNAANTQLASQTMVPNETNPVVFQSSYTAVPGAGSVTWKLNARNFSANDVTMAATTTDVGSILVEDIWVKPSAMRQASS